MARQHRVVDCRATRTVKNSHKPSSGRASKASRGGNQQNKNVRARGRDVARAREREKGTERDGGIESRKGESCESQGKWWRQWRRTRRKRINKLASVYAFMGRIKIWRTPVIHTSIYKWTISIFYFYSNFNYSNATWENILIRLMVINFAAIKKKMQDKLL